MTMIDSTPPRERTDNFLAHYGVLGMKWGVRKDVESQRQRLRLTNASFRKSDNERAKKVALSKRILEDSRNMYKEDEAKELAKIKPQQLKIEKKALALAKKYNLDEDDGGGGDGSPESTKAGQQYMDLWEEHFNLEKNAWAKAKTSSGERLVKKYGQDKLDWSSNFERKKSRKRALQIIGLTGAITLASILITK